jgi:hypothetical protein
LAAIPSLRGTDRSFILRTLSQQLGLIPDSPARTVSARMLHSLIVRTPLDEHVARAAQQLNFSMFPENERTARFNEVLGVHERLVQNGLMPTTPGNPLGFASVQVPLLPANDRAAASARIIAMRDAMAARGTPIWISENALQH